MVNTELLPPAVATEPSVDLAETGWRYVEEVQPDGTIREI